MHAFTIAATSVAALASIAQAVPHGHSHRHAHVAEKRQGSTFELTIENHCPTSKTFGLFQVSPSFEMVSMSDPVPIESGSSSTIQAPFNEVGMRLSATADQGTAGQWAAQSLFEFSYSTYGGQEGTAYDLSLMQGVENLEGVAAYPGTSDCPTKMCTVEGCSLAEAWTNPDQTSDGSPADTVCYQGMQNFKVVWCPLL